MKITEYNTKEGKVTITWVKVEESFTNSFAERVLKLENGDVIFIGYNEDYIQIKHTEKEQ